MVAISRAEQKRRWRIKYPEKVREERRKYLERKILKNPENLKHIHDRILQDFDRLTRLTFGEVLPKVCEMCGKTENLHIHHKQYVYPIVKEDLMRVCIHCHMFIHNQILPFNKELPTDKV